MTPDQEWKVRKAQEHALRVGLCARISKLGGELEAGAFYSMEDLWLALRILERGGN